MPERHYKPRSRYALQLMMADAANANMLVKLRCSLCRRTTYFLAADILALYGNQPFFEFRLPCSRDKTDEFVTVDYRNPESGDYGNLKVRRPWQRVTIQKWKTVRLGDEVPG